MECAICNESFKNPKVLSCSHQFCELCIREWILKSRTKTGIECPLCRSITTPPKHGTSPELWGSMLPDYVAVEETVLCQPCGFAKETKVAKFYCMECNEYLCGVCHSSHSKLKLSKFHKTVQVENAGVEKTSVYAEYRKLLMCKIHPDKVIEFYCEDDDEMFCSTCAFLYHRSCDEVLEIKNNYTDIEYTTPLSALSKWLGNLRVHTQEHIAIRRQFGTNLEKDALGLKTKLNETKRKFLKAFERAEGQIIKQMEDKNHRNKQANEDLLAEFESTVQCIDETDRITTELMNIEMGAPEYAIVSRNLEHRYNEIKDKIEKVNQSNEQFSSQTFVLNNNFLDSLTRISTLGSLKEEEWNYKVPNIEESKPAKERVLKLDRQFLISKARNKAFYSSAAYYKDDKDATVVLADQTNKRLVMLTADRDKEMKTVRLSSKPYMIMTTKKYIYVSFPEDKKIRKYDIGASLQGLSEICTRAKCYAIGIDSKFDDGKIVVSLSNEDSWELVTYNCNGREIGAIDKERGCDEFKSIWHFKLIDNILYQSCQVDDKVYGFKLENDICEYLFSYNHSKLKCPAGIDVDCDKNIYVCGIISRNIHVITQDGAPIKVLKLAEVEVPTNIAFCDNTEDAVVLGNASAPGPFLYQLT